MHRSRIWVLACAGLAVVAFLAHLSDRGMERVTASARSDIGHAMDVHWTWDTSAGKSDSDPRILHLRVRNSFSSTITNQASVTTSDGRVAYTNPVAITVSWPVRAVCLQVDLERGYVLAAPVTSDGERLKIGTHKGQEIILLGDMGPNEEKILQVEVRRDR